MNLRTSTSTFTAGIAPALIWPWSAPEARGPRLVDYGAGYLPAPVKSAQVEPGRLGALSNPFAAHDLPIGDEAHRGDAITAPAARTSDFIADPARGVAFPVADPTDGAARIVDPHAEGAPDGLWAGMEIIRDPDSFEALRERLGVEADPPYEQLTDKGSVKEYLDGLHPDEELHGEAALMEKGAMGELLIAGQLYSELRDDDCYLIHSVDVPFTEEDGRKSWRRPDHILLHPRLLANIESKRLTNYALKWFGGKRIEQMQSEQAVAGALQAMIAIEGLLRLVSPDQDVSVLPIVADTTPSMRPPGLEINTSVDEPVYEEIPWHDDAPPWISSVLIGRSGRRGVHYTDNGIWIARFMVQASRRAYSPEQLESYKDALLKLPRLTW